MHGAPQRLRCEYLDNPLGIDIARPRLSWWVNDDRPAEIQTAYQILAASTADLLKLNEGDFWDSGRVESRATVGIEYQGKALKSGRRVWWKLRSFDSDGLPSPWSESAFFEPGLMDSSEWQGRWIGAPLQGSSVASVPVPLLARTFDVPAPVRSARLYVAVLGQVAIQMNGVRVGNRELAPGWVDYQQRVEYLTLDVSDILEHGANRLSLLLADGWYAGDTGGGYRQQYGTKPWLKLQLHITLDSFERIVLLSDDRWCWRPSWILGADPVAGECCDGAQTCVDWIAGERVAAGAGSGWFPVAVMDAEMLELNAAMLPVERIDEPLEGELVDWRESRMLVRFDHPIIGRARVLLRSAATGVLRIRYGQSLDDRGELAGVVTEDLYTAAGAEAGEVFEATFSQHGFRYVEILGDIYQRDTISVGAVTIRQPVAVTGEFVCDHETINTLYADIAGHQRRTQQSVAAAAMDPASRCGHTRDFGAGIGSRLLNLDAAPLAVKWLNDMADAQFPEGGFPVVVPAPPGQEQLCRDGGAGASDAFIEVLWQLFRHHGDRRLLREHYGAVRRFVEGLSCAAVGFIREDPDYEGACPGDLCATAWFYRSARHASRISGVLGNLSDLEEFEELASHIRSAFYRRFVTPDGRVIGDNLEAYALTLGFGLLESPLRDLAARSLFDLCERTLRLPPVANGAAHRVPHLLGTLTRLGRLDLAYRIALGGRESSPATLAASGAGEWIFTALAGFELPRDLSESSNAFRHLLLHPRPPLGLGFGDAAGEPPLREVDAALDTINGRYEAGWRITDHAFEFFCLVPANCSAEIILPDETHHQVAAGRHELVMMFGEAGDGIPVLREVS